MSCGVPKLLKYYTDKVNVYTSDCFIPLPAWRTCPPPSMPIIGPYGPVVRPPGEPFYPPHPYMSGYASNTNCSSGRCGPCGK
jgi:hypothetical protein